ncbi:MAG: DUF2513 domain-containing protein [Vicinamibacterales bacterium]
MHRDMDLVRQIALAIEDAPTGYAPRPFRLEGCDEKRVGYHVLIMMEAGLVLGHEVTSLADSTPHAVPTRLTWAGHEFAAAARNDTAWTSTKAAIGKVGAATFPIWLKLLSEYAMKHTGLG